MGGGEGELRRDDDQDEREIRGIMAKKEDPCVKRHDMNEEKKAERFEKFMVATEKKIKLEEKRDELAANPDDAKMLTLKTENLDPDAAKTV